MSEEPKAPSRALATLSDRHKYVAIELEKARERLHAIIPPSTGLGASRAIAVVLDALSRNPDLLKCSPPTIVRSVLHAAELGLEIGSVIGEAFLVPFKSEATMMVGYRGFVKLIRQAPRVELMKAVLVHEADTFEVDEGENRITHKRAPGSLAQRGPVVFAYSRVWYQGGASQFEVMDRSELDAIKTAALSKGRGGFSPWRTHENEMMKKCPVRRQAKMLDLSPLPRRAVELDDLEGMRRGELGALREGFSNGRAAELRDMIASRDKPVTSLDAERDAIQDAEIE